MGTCQRSSIRALLAVVAVAVGAASAAAQPGPPVITGLAVPGGTTVSTDRLSVVVSYQHPAMVGAPIPFYRIRTKRPDDAMQAWGTFQPNERNTNTFSVWLQRRQMTDPFPGEHIIEVQLRDGQGQVSQPVAIAVTRVVTAPPAVASGTPVEYRVTAAALAELLGVARLRGYLNTAEAMNPNSRCSSQQGANQRWELYVVHVLGGGVPSPRCRFRFFTGRTLQTGWHLRSAAFVPDPGIPVTYVFEHAIKPVGTDASFSVVATAPGAVTPRGWMSLTELVFEGPANTEWRQAFRP